MDGKYIPIRCPKWDAQKDQRICSKGDAQKGDAQKDQRICSKRDAQKGDAQKDQSESVQKITAVSLGWYLVQRLIQIYRNQWWCSRFLFETGNTLLGQFGWKVSV